MKAKCLALLLVFASLLVLGCEERIDGSDSGGVILSLSLGTQFPFRVSVNSNDALQLDMDIRSIIGNINAVTSPLQDVEIKTMEVTFARADVGTRVPPPFFRAVGGTVPAGGVLNLTLTVMSLDQLRTPPLSDLLFVNGGFDKETGNTDIKLNVSFRFFGETISGREVETQTLTQLFEFTQ